MKALSGSAVMLMIPTLGGVAWAETINFHNLTVGPATPPGWNCTQTGEGDVKWSIVRDDYPPNFWNVLEQTGTGAMASNPYPTPSVYPICILNPPTLKDGFAQVKIKLV
jgi:hypothetical protein